MRARYALIAVISLVLAWCPGCSNKQASAPHGPDLAKRTAHEHEHKSAHGGVLNAIVTCENGHAEVKLDGAKLRLWFVGGGADTNKSVRVPDKSIKLEVNLNGKTRSLQLAPKPLELAGEKTGDSSHFEGSAEWLKGVRSFEASGTINFKGTPTALRIEYPKGYDPD